MKIIIVGASGTIGKAVAAALGKRHEILTTARNGADLQVDITAETSIEKFYASAGPFDALVSVAGEGHWGPFAAMKEADFYKGIRSKMMGQINLVLAGQHYINPGGSFTLTSGILSKDPVPGASNLSVVNAAVEAFAIAAAIELEKGLRINAVSPGVVEESWEKFRNGFPGHLPVSMQKVVSAYTKSVEGKQTGKVYEVF